MSTGRRFMAGGVAAGVLVVGVTAGAAAASSRSHYRQATLTSSSKHAATFLGLSVAISGNTMVVGAPATVTGRGGGQGAAYVYSKPRHGGWRNAKETAVLTAAKAPATFGDGLGYGVAIAGNTIAASDPEADKGRGAVFVFAEGKHGWTSTSHPGATLTGRGADPVAEVGLNLAMTNSAIVAEAENASNGTDAVVFSRSKHGWRSGTDSALLTTPSTPLSQPGQVAVSGDTIVMSLQRANAAYVFVRGSGGWTDATPTTSLTESNEAGGDDAFGDSVAISGSTVMVGAPGSDVDGSGSIPGAVYEYDKPVAGWSSAGSLTESATIMPTADPITSDFGTSVGLTKNTLAAGAPYATVKGQRYAGDVVGFTKPAGGWSAAKQGATLTEPRPKSGDSYGFAVAVHGTSIAITSPFAAKEAGRAYVLTPR